MTDSKFDPTPSPEDLAGMFELGGTEDPPLQAAIDRLKNLGANPSGDEITAALNGVVDALDGADSLRIEGAQWDAKRALKDAKISGAARLVKAAFARLAESPPVAPAPISDRDQLLADLDSATEQALAAQPADVRAEAEDLLMQPDLIDRILADAEALGVAGERELALSIYMVATSRLLAKPNAAIVQGPSSTGKSYIAERVAKMMPGEAVLSVTSMTANALFYLPEGELIHRLVLAGERSRVEDDETADATRALREMLSAGELHKAVAVKEDGRIITRTLHQHGPIAYIESTTLTRLFDEDANRCLLLATDESTKQTRRVLVAHADRDEGRGPDPSPVIARHQAAQRMLRRVNVVIPFAHRIAAAMPDDRPEARRAYSHLSGMIRAIALLHQRQRARGPLAHGDTIEAAPVDYAIAAQLLRGPLGRALGRNLPRATANAAIRWRDRYKDGAFTAADVLRDDTTMKEKRTVNRHLRTLADLGIAEEAEPAHGSKPAKWRITADPTDTGADWLPTIEDLESGNEK